MNLKNSLIKNLFLLMIVFILGYSFVVGMHQYFNNAIHEMDMKIKNEDSRYKIGKYILDEIHNIESNFYKMSLSTNLNTIKPIKNEIKHEIEDIRKAINILKNGGVQKDYIRLNLVGLEKIEENIKFTPSKDLNYTFEGIDLLPKLINIENKLEEIDNIIIKKQKALVTKSKTEKQKLDFQVQIFYKQIPPMFVRMKENASRLLYESRKNSNLIENKIIENKEFYKNLEYLITLLIMITVITFAFIISKQIQRKSEELKNITEEARNSAIEASKANKVKSQFLANMSHEIRTPLNAIIGFSEILSNSKLKPKEKEQASIITKSAKSLLDIINDILDISKVESGRFELVSEKFDTRNFFEQIVELYSVSSDDKKIRFIFNYDTSIPKSIIGDSTRLKQVISNLLSNAIKFTSEGKHVIFTIKAIDIKDDKTKLFFSIKDEGIGINKEDQKKVFQPFSQADNSISRSFGGTGLGLAISSKIINMMGSEIELKSQKGKGSEFFFILELASEASEEKSNKKLECNFAISNPLEDEENIRFNLKNYLDELGHLYNLETLHETDKKIDLIFFFGEESLIDTITKLKKKFNSKLVFVGDANKLGNFNTSIIDYKIDVPLYGSKIFNIISSACNLDKTSIKNESFGEKLEGKVLVAEDNINNQRLIDILLENLNLDVTIVDDGLQAYNEYLKNDYDLILMDINMPIMDGLQSLNKIKNSEKYEKVKPAIVALTANTIKGDKEKYLNSGMDDYLSKPIDTKELNVIAKKYLKTSKNTSLEEQEPKEEQEIKEDNTSNSRYKKIDTINQLALNEKIVDKLLSKFLQTLDADILKLEEAIESKDNDKIYQAAHYLKGPCANYAMKFAQELLLEFENIAKNDLDKEYELEKLKEYFEEVKEELNKN